MNTFLTELCETFPDCPILFATRDAAKLMQENDERSVLDKYVKEISPHAQALTDMNDSFFMTADIKFLKDIGIQKYWTPELEPETKNAIWQYLQTLLVMGQTIQSVPPQLLRMLEGYASKMTTQLNGNPPENLDMHTLGMGALQHMQETDPNAFRTFIGGGGGDANTAHVEPRAELRAHVPNGAPKPPSQHVPQQNNKAPVGWEALQKMCIPAAVPPTSIPQVPHAPFRAQFTPAQVPAPVWGTPTAPLYGNHNVFLGGNRGPTNPKAKQ